MPARGLASLELEQNQYFILVPTFFFVGPNNFAPNTTELSSQTETSAVHESIWLWVKKGYHRGIQKKNIGKRKIDQNMLPRGISF